MVDATRLVLVVDDHEATREAFSLLLRRVGYRVALAGNGQQALDQLHGTDRPSLILLDLSMPVMDGWRFRAEQRRDPRIADIPVVVCTSTWEVQESVAGLDAVGYLVKPVEGEELLAQVQRHCC